MAKRYCMADFIHCDLGDPCDDVTAEIGRRECYDVYRKRCIDAAHLMHCFNDLWPVYTQNWQEIVEQHFGEGK